MIYDMMSLRVLLVIPFLVTSASAEDVGSVRKEFTFPFSERAEPFLKRLSAKEAGFVDYFRGTDIEFKTEPVFVLDTENNVLKVETEHNSAVRVMRFMGHVERMVFVKPKPTAAELAAKKQQELLDLEKKIEGELKSLKWKINVLGDRIVIGSKSYAKGEVLVLKLNNKSHQLEVFTVSKEKVEFYDASLKKMRVLEFTPQRFIPEGGVLSETLSREEELKLESELMDKFKGKVNVLGSKFFVGGRIFKEGESFRFGVARISCRFKVVSVSQSKIVFQNEISKKTTTLKLQSDQLVPPIAPKE